MGVNYVNDFSYPASFGFTGSAQPSPAANGQPMIQTPAQTGAMMGQPPTQPAPVMMAKGGSMKMPKPRAPRAPKGEGKPGTKHVPVADAAKATVGALKIGMALGARKAAAAAQAGAPGGGIPGGAMPMLGQDPTGGPPPMPPGAPMGGPPPGMKKGGHFIQDMHMKKGELHKNLGVPAGEKIPAGKMAAAAKQSGKVGERARFAETLKGMKKG